ncbi:MAG TPA: UvrD-helicase domain-containing protein [Gammaproteobacteria bacterium]|nr:UvrD-helicase domain-containing protein [Gammaproteobacteria bacterium]
MTDAAARAAALDPSRSFIVQAPAGSGKTELLIQRYLALLATVQQPEQVVAITFTRKAAAEMRRRVQKALRAAADGAAGAHAHERTTLQLARVVVERDAALDWTLLRQPQRLRVDTLDAFNVWLAQQLPVLADGVAAARIVDKPDDYHREAARRTVAAIAGDDATFARDLRILLRGVENDADRLSRMLAALLARRDQWLTHLGGDSATEPRPALEAALQRLVDDELAAVAALCPVALLPALAPLLRHAATFAGDTLRAELEPWLALDRPPRDGPLALAAWRGVAALLLTREGEWRKRIAKPEGFGPEHAAARDRCRELLDGLRAEDAFRHALAGVPALPASRYTEPQWRNLAALRRVLLHLVAELKVLFAERRTVDFTELALAARRALGQVDAPSDLLLALDRRIQHILVDEFQDTSQSQLRLLELLTAGWQRDDGRTLFLVGDPMQSIYRFRDADMSLFLRAKQRGIGHVALRSLTLTNNFRSAPEVVDWVNSVFARVFPAEDQLATGMAAFRPSSAVRAAAAGQFVRVTPVVSAAVHAEAERVVDILAAERARDPDQSMAVLVQSRTHLTGLRERLRARGWPVHAVEIDTLEEQQVAQDLAGLTRALLHPGDRIAWLAALRAPWCGLSWGDLEALCGDTDAPIVDLWQAPDRLARLSEDGRARLAAFVAVFGRALERRDGSALARWVELTWRDLDGPDCLDDDADLHAADQFFALLANAERDGDLADPADLHSLLRSVQPQADPPREQGIEIMTMHRAKGLEFDTVVLLGLAREPRPDDPRALQWLNRVAGDGTEDLLVVPAALPGDDTGARLTDFVRSAERARDLAERARLLYVATTRARERLYLVWQQPPEFAGPKTGTMLAHVWPALGVQAAAAEAPPATEGGGAGPLAVTPGLRRLALRRAPDVATADAAPQIGVTQPEFAWAGQAAVHVGTVVHRQLQRFADTGVGTWTAARVRTLMPAFTRELLLLGVEPAEAGQATDRVVAALTRAIEDPLGRWVLGAHAEAQSEFKLTIRNGELLEHLRLDRTFVADGKRWIVDFKTSQHEGGDLAAFLDSEVERYRPQLERYARALAAVDTRPIHLGLYFPLLAEFRSWPATTANR